jgi:mevalonate pyrophosphate decarboxylase
MTQLSLIIYTAKLGMLLYQTRLKQAAYRVKQMKIAMLCADFIKIIKNKFRLKMT